MKKVKIETLRTIVNLFKVASKDKAMLVTNSVNIKFYEEYCVLQSTNGFSCNETKLIDPDFLEFIQTKKSFVISAKNEKRLKLMLKENKDNSYFYIDDTFTLYNSAEKMLINLDIIAQDYVALDAVIGNLEAKSSDFKLAVSFKELKKLVESMENTSKNGVITFNLNRYYMTQDHDCYLKPIVLTSPCTIDQKTVLMPCKV